MPQSIFLPEKGSVSVSLSWYGLATCRNGLHFSSFPSAHTTTTHTDHSLAVFVVSDSEDVGSSGEEVESDGEEVKVESDVKEEDCYCLNENAPPHLPHTPWKVPSATSSCTTPYTGEVFWGSPGTDSTTAAKSTTQLRPTLKCTPLVDRNHVCLTTPVKG